MSVRCPHCGASVDEDEKGYDFSFGTIYDSFFERGNVADKCFKGEDEDYDYYYCRECRKNFRKSKTVLGDLLEPFMLF